jgi:hypothetical protein
MPAACDSALWCIVYNYQTLIVGVVGVAAAIAAAFYAAWPVWRQLDRMSVQTNTLFRDFLHDRIETTRRRRKWFAERLGAFSNEAARGVNHAEQFEDGAINSHWAFDQDQTAGALLNDVRRYREDWSDQIAIESGLDEVIAKLEALQDSFNAIHRPSSTDQTGEDYAFSDEEWAGVEAAGRQAEKDLSGLVGAFSESVKRLDGAFSDQLKSLRERLRQVEHLLLRP